MLQEEKKIPKNEACKKFSLPLRRRSRKQVDVSERAEREIANHLKDMSLVKMNL
jgi:hypothetical protein